MPNTQFGCPASYWTRIAVNSTAAEIVCPRRYLAWVLDMRSKRMEAKPHSPECLNGLSIIGSGTIPPRLSISGADITPPAAAGSLPSMIPAPVEKRGEVRVCDYTRTECVLFRRDDV